MSFFNPFKVHFNETYNNYIKILEICPVFIGKSASTRVYKGTENNSINFDT